MGYSIPKQQNLEFLIVYLMRISPKTETDIMPLFWSGVCSIQLAQHRHHCRLHGIDNIMNEPIIFFPE